MLDELEVAHQASNPAGIHLKRSLVTTYTLRELADKLG